MQCGYMTCDGNNTRLQIITSDYPDVRTLHILSLHLPGSDDRTVRLWDCETGQCIKIFRTHTVADVKFDNKQIITASFDNTAACWDMVTGERVRHYRGHIGAVFTVDYDEEVDVLVTGLYAANLSMQ